MKKDQELFMGLVNLNKQLSCNSYILNIQELEIEIVYRALTCSSNPWIRRLSFGILHLYKGVLHVCALYFAFQTRKVKIEGLNNAKYITALVYTISIVLAITATAPLTLTNYINVYAVVYSFGFWLANSAILGFLFIPKVCIITWNCIGLMV